MESKCIEALNKIIEYIGTHQDQDLVSAIGVVRQDLERLEFVELSEKTLDQICESQHEEIEELQEQILHYQASAITLTKENIKYYQQIEKLKKAIDILKGKLELCESIYSQLFNSNEYYLLCNKTLTQQEYELLKEVLE